MLLENLRFDIREEKNGADFAKALADMAEVYVSDAFGTVHRAHASTAGVAAYLPAYAGLLVEKELSVMGKALDDPKRPFVAVLGGAKVSDKIGVINNLLEKADTVIIGGGMAYTFIKAMGYEIGNSLLEADKLDYALEMIEKAKRNGVSLLLPVDTAVGNEFKADCDSEIVDIKAMPAGWMGMDIGPKTIKLFSDEGLKSTGGLSNNSNGAPKNVRPIMDSALVAMAMMQGLTSAIVNPNDLRLMETIKSCDIFKNNELYSDSYLDA